MGSGKGNVSFWVAVIKPGKVLYEVAGIPFNSCLSALRVASYKIPFDTRVIKRDLLFCFLICLNFNL